ncbi:MAG TPA: serine hydrolase [Dehalococcoidia bacterium]
MSPSAQRYLIALAVLLAAALLWPGCAQGQDPRPPSGDAAQAPAGPAPPTPTPAPPPPEWTALEDRLAQVVAASPVEGRFAVAVMDLQTGHLLSVNGSRPQRAGCVVNLFVLLTVMRDVAAGRYPLETVDALLDQTIWSSNSVTARELYGIAGEGDVLDGLRRVRALIHGIPGVRQTVLDHPPSFVDETLGVSVDNLVTAEDAVHALAALYHGRILEEPWRTDMLDRLTAVYSGLNYLLASVPADAVSHKNGYYYEPLDGTWVDNDIGIVRFRRGGQEYAYAMAFLSEGVPVELADVTLGQRVARLVWEYFQEAYPRA